MSQRSMSTSTSSGNNQSTNYSKTSRELQRHGSLKAWYDEAASSPKNSSLEDHECQVIPFQLDDGVDDGEEIRRRRQYSSSGSSSQHSSEEEEEEEEKQGRRRHGASGSRRSKQPEQRTRSNTNSSSRHGSRKSSSLSGRRQRENEWERAERDEKECSDDEEESCSSDEDSKGAARKKSQQQQQQRQQPKSCDKDKEDNVTSPEVRSRSNTPSQSTCRRQPIESCSSDGRIDSGSKDRVVLSTSENPHQEQQQQQQQQQQEEEEEEEEQQQQQQQQEQEQQKRFCILNLSNLSKLSIYPGSDKMLIQGHIIRTKHLLSPQYHFYIQNQLILMAEKKFKNRTSNYHIFDMTRTMKGGTKLTKKSGNYLGKLRSSNSKRKNVLISNQMDHKSELGAIIFGANTNSSQPRRVSMILPSLHPRTNEIEPVLVNQCQEQEQEFSTLLSMVKSTTGNISSTSHTKQLKLFVNKEPVYENGFYRLNFQGRVSLPSVKNFQLVQAEVEEVLDALSKKKSKLTTSTSSSSSTGSTKKKMLSKSKQEQYPKVLLQFGKVDDNKFHLDFAAPITPIQAFGVAIAQFNL